MLRGERVVCKTGFPSGLENKKNRRAFSNQGKVREFCSDWKNRGILPKTLEKIWKIKFNKWQKMRMFIGGFLVKNIFRVTPLGIPIPIFTFKSRVSRSYLILFYPIFLAKSYFVLFFLGNGLFYPIFWPFCL